MKGLNMNDKPKYMRNTPPFVRYVAAAIPMVFDDSLSYYEALCALWKYIQGMTDVINANAALEQDFINRFNNLSGKFDELKSYIDHYFDNLDVQEEINNKLDEMVEDGTLDSIISKYISIQENNYITDICTLAYRSSNETKGLQGGCYCGDGNVACYFSTTHTIQIISLSTGQVLREMSDDRFGHGNGMCKKGDYLYLLGTGNNVTNKIYKIDYDTLNDIEVIDPYGDNLIPTGSNISSICYSANTNHFYITLGLPFPTLYCYEMNEDFTELINSYEIDNNEEYGGFITNICHWNKYILVNYQLGKTQIFNENDFSLYKTINIDKNVGNRYYSEFEWLDSYSDTEIIIGAVCESGNGYGNGIFSFGTCNLYSSYRDFPGNYKRGKGTTGEIIKGQNNVWVDTNATFKVKRLGTQDDPFISIYEATNSLKLDGYDETIIRVVEGSDISNQGIYLYNTSLVKILYNPTNNDIVAREIYCQSNQQVYIRGILSNNVFAKETNLVLFKNTNTKMDISIEGYNTSIINFQCPANSVNITGSSGGQINFTNFNKEYGVVGVYDQNNSSYTDMIECRNIQNVFARCRLDGELYTPSNTLTFYTSLNMPKEIIAQVGDMYVSIPIYFYKNLTTIVKMPDGTDLTVTREYDTTTYNRTTMKYVLSHQTLRVYDAFIAY